MPPRARPLPPDARRAELTDVTLRLLRVHGRAVTTRQIAEAAGVAEGTIFRVFDSKDELVDAALARAFEPGDVVARIEGIDRGQPLRGRLVDLVALLQQRFRATFDLMQKVELVGPPHHLHDSEEADAWRARLEALLADVVGDGRDGSDQLAVPVDHFVHVLRLLTFAGSHQKIADGRLLSPDQVVDTLLHGLAHPDRGRD
ncbi:TetR family transcriptional regulator [Nocardioides psychrotolerans]|uniref:Transcriptional regulator, TetR family n=1 Tax=Nocardioides psychrotolerans TaxID=1005945 RepID=A0A1I3HV89_9ACTN|nr:TetR/AcrR family transcriptional regulator [Nocardioides psychrotolerans]GEP38713.1 TetR family transcriptional regulator [Nocardioides psychrotolerans]SFI39678.1 transcriptional regulator, TetR family [Nocardioides psychrotolerans]